MSMDRADVGREDSEGSEEKLLGDSNNEPTDERDGEGTEEEEEDDDIARLMGFKNNESDEETSGGNTRTKLFVSKSRNRSGPSDNTDDGNGSKLVRIESLPEVINYRVPVSSTKRPPSTAILNRQEKMRKMYEKHNSETSKMICGVLCMFIILGVGISCLFFAKTMGMKDLYIIGGIFTSGGVLFTLSFIVLRCTVDKRNSETDYSALFRSPDV